MSDTSAKPLADYLHKLAPKATQANLNIGVLPSVEHCIGTQRFLGELGGQAITEVYSIENSEEAIALSKLAVCLRSFVVLDDFLVDTRPSQAVSNSVHGWLNNIKDEIFDLIRLLGDNPEPLWGNHFDIYEQAFANFDREKLFESILRKCFLTFLPFELSLLRHSPNNDLFRRYVEYYLFSLQLMDDFHDMEEDMDSPHNHNLFLVSVSAASRKCVIDAKPLMVRSLIEYANHNLQSLHGLKSEIVQASLQNSLTWLSKAEQVTLHLPKLELFRGSFEEFWFDGSATQDCKRKLNTRISADLAFIKAENMHSLS